MTTNNNDLCGIAIIGMAGRFPKAENIYEFWQNLVQGKECISFYSDEELVTAGIPNDFIINPYYVKAKGELKDIDLFDASFFGINRHEAEVMDPQHRLLLECAWEALENSGYVPEKYDGTIGVYAGESMGSYAFLNVFPYLKTVLSTGNLQAAIGNDKDSLTTTIAYRLNLKGPAITIQSASSTSLVAVCLACQSLLAYQCDMALAGGVSAGPPLQGGYMYEEGGIMSSDGHCRAFDAKSDGFVPGNGLGMVVLKRLEDAVRDGDYIWSVIKGFAINNDGSTKVSYSAPSIEAQAEAIIIAQAFANIAPETIGYIETHGTGTKLGDPIEIAALNRAFQSYTNKTDFCAIGSVKTNIGHLDTAAGIAGLIKVAMALNYKLIPPSLHFTQPNPNINFTGTPFFVNTKLSKWNDNNTPRRAGITSLGMGGTNAHVVLEEWLSGALNQNAEFWRLIFISGRTEAVLKNNTQKLLSHLKQNNKTDIDDIAYTLLMGRKEFNYRRALVCKSTQELIRMLEDNNSQDTSSPITSLQRSVIFMFTGQGSQYINMGRDLYEKEKIFRSNFDKCVELLKPYLNMDLRQIVYPSPKDNNSHQDKLEQTAIAQPLIFSFEYALAQVWLSWGIHPVGMIGHSLGEYVAATIAGCFSLEDALKITALRGKLMQNQVTGAMLTVGLNEFEAENFLSDDINLAAINSPGLCVLSGDRESLEKVKSVLTQKNVFCKWLFTSHAFHSKKMIPMMEEFHKIISTVKLKKPQIPFLSCLTGTWISADEVTNASYWVKQIVEPVRFRDGMLELLNDNSRVFIEIGPGNSLCHLANQQKNNCFNLTTIPSVRHVKESCCDDEFLIKAVARLWLNGVSLDWQRYYVDKRHKRIPLPTYAFARERYWIKSNEEKLAPSNIRVFDDKIDNDLCQSEQVVAPNATTNQLLRNNQDSFDIDGSITKIWEELLGAKPVGEDDNFFDAGGDSLLVTQFLSRIRDKFQIQIPVKTMFQNPTITSIKKEINTIMVKANSSKKLSDILQDCLNKPKDK